MLVVLDATRFERFEYIPLPNTRGDAEIMRCKFQLRVRLIPARLNEGTTIYLQTTEHRLQRREGINY